MKKKVFVMLVMITVKNLSAQNFRVPKCNPWRNISGYSSLCAELSSFNCARLLCNGTSTTTILSSFLLQDNNNSIYTFSSNQIISATIQNQIILQAKNWANAHKPSPNYTIETITYIPNIVTSSGTITYAGIDIKVLYKACTGPRVLPN
jgi:hypothetical protein